MTSLRDEFKTVHQKDGYDYVQWSQVADRLDDVVPGWSFNIMAIDVEKGWIHGRLTIGPCEFDGIGYAENIDAKWKKEPLKDAASDALKRCAAVAGVARYLYDKDDAEGSARTSSPRPPQAPPAAVTAVAGDEPPWAAPEPIPARGGPFAPMVPRDAEGGDVCPEHRVGWVLQPAGTSKAGKKYGAFWKCPHKGPPFCDHKPSAEWQARHETAA